MIDKNQYEAVIFDMDGVLIDSEPLWKIAMEEVFTSVGCTITRKDFQKTVGLRIDEVIAYWYSVQPWKVYSEKEVELQIIRRMEMLILQNGQSLPGVVETLSFLRENGFKIGLGTSSYEVLVDSVLAALDLKNHFDFTHSAEHEAFGKPHPAVYLRVAEKLNVSPTKCLVIEDSLTGIIAAKAARMSVVAIPEKTHEPNPKIQVADYLFDDMHQFLAAFK